MININFTDHIHYANPTSGIEKYANASEDFFNWSGHTVVIVKGKIAQSEVRLFNLPYVTLKFLSCLTLIIPLAFLILRTYTRGILLSNISEESSSLYGRAKPKKERVSLPPKQPKSFKNRPVTESDIDMAKKAIQDTYRLIQKNQNVLHPHAKTALPFINKDFLRHTLDEVADKKQLLKQLNDLYQTWLHDYFPLDALKPLQEAIYKLTNNI